MKNILFFLTLVLFSQQNNLDAMHPLGVGHKSSRHVDKLANLRIHIEKEAQEAAATIQKWLTPELASKLEESDDSQDSNATQLNTDALKKLPIGQQIVLTQWKVYPHYGALVLYWLPPMTIPRFTNSWGFFRSFTQQWMSIRYALIEHNFGKKVLERWKLCKDISFLNIRFKEFSLQLQELRRLSEGMSSLEFQEKLELCEADLQDCFFILQYSCLFLSLIKNFADNNDYDVIKLFLDYGLNPNVLLPGAFGSLNKNNSLLKIAVAQENIEGTLLLLEHQADPLYSVQGLSPMTMSCPIIKNSKRIRSSQAVHDIHTILSRSVSEEALKKCECDAQIALLEEHLKLKLLNLPETNLVSNNDKRIIFFSLLKIYENCSLKYFPGTKSSHIFTNILAQLKFSEEKKMQKNMLFERTIIIILGLLFVNITDNSVNTTGDADIYSPFYNPSDYEKLFEHVSTWSSDFESNFAKSIYVDDMHDDELALLKKKSYKKVFHCIQELIAELNDEIEFSLSSIYKALDLIKIFNHLIKNNSDILAEPIRTILSTYEDNDIFVETQNNDLDNIINSDDEIQNS